MSAEIKPIIMYEYDHYAMCVKLWIETENKISTTDHNQCSRKISVTPG